MLTVTKLSTKRVDINLQGKLGSVGMRNALNDLVEKTEGVKNGRMLYTVSEFALPTLGAIVVELSYLPKLFGLLGKFDRCAVICDAAWLRKLAEIKGVVVPGIKIKSFEPGQETDAESWLA